MRRSLRYSTPHAMRFAHHLAFLSLASLCMPSLLAAVALLMRLPPFNLPATQPARCHPRRIAAAAGRDHLARAAAGHSGPAPHARQVSVAVDGACCAASTAWHVVCGWQGGTMQMPGDSLDACWTRPRRRPQDGDPYASSCRLHQTHAAPRREDPQHLSVWPAGPARPAAVDQAGRCG